MKWPFRPRRPRLRTLLLFLLLGAAVNVAVAWGPMVLIDARTRQKSWDDYPTTQREADLWARHVIDGGSNAPGRYRAFPALVWNGRQIGVESGRAFGVYFANEFEGGFPTCALVLETWHMETSFRPAE